MECNKDEAMRAMEIATKKFFDKDFIGAKKFALKAQNLYPSLEGIAQMILNLDVHISARTKVNGEMDWYTILGVHPTADSATIKKQYRKSALSYHPDKNKSVGAESTFQIISEGFSVLMDDAKRSAYDHKLKNQRVVQPNAPWQGATIPVRPGDGQRGPTISVPQNGLGKGGSFNRPPYWNWNQQPGCPGAYQRPPPSQSAGPSHGYTDSQRKPQPHVNPHYSHNKGYATAPTWQAQGKSAAQGLWPRPRPQQDSMSSQDKMEPAVSFWTKCSGCRRLLEYYRFCINKNLLCQFCKTAFVGVEITRPSSLQKKVTTYSRNQSQPAIATESMVKGNNMAASSSLHGAADMSQSINKGKREREEANRDGKTEKKQKQSDQHAGRNPGFNGPWNSMKVGTKGSFECFHKPEREVLSSLK